MGEICPGKINLLTYLEFAAALLPSELLENHVMLDADIVAVSPASVWRVLSVVLPAERSVHFQLRRDTTSTATVTFPAGGTRGFVNATWNQ